MKTRNFHVQENAYLISFQIILALAQTWKLACFDFWGHCGVSQTYTRREKTMTNKILLQSGLQKVKIIRDVNFRE